MNEMFIKTMECLASSVENNEVTNVEKLTLAINDLESFPMTFAVLENSKISQTLQSIRRSKQITMFISERIRSLIKCWRHLLNADIVSVIPNEIRGQLSKTPAVKSGYTNGYVLENRIVQNEIIRKEEEPVEDNFKYKRKIWEDNIEKVIEDVLKNGIEEEFINNLTKEMGKETRKKSTKNNCKENENKLQNISNSCKVTETLLSNNESQQFQNSQNGKPKVKSTKELLADFSHFVESDIKEKILTDRICQEDDEPLSYFPQDTKVKEMVKVSIMEQEKERSKRFFAIRTSKEKREEFMRTAEQEEPVSNQTYCQFLLEQFQNLHNSQPKVFLNHFVPWGDLSQGIPLGAPEIKPPPPVKKRIRKRASAAKPPPIYTPLSLDVINNLLESYEGRTQQTRMFTKPVLTKKCATNVIDNTLSLVDMSMKLKLKIPALAILKPRPKKRRGKTKMKPKLKVEKPPKAKEPRKPKVRLIPPITNYLDDIPSLPLLDDGQVEIDLEDDDEVGRIPIECNEENVRKLVHGIIEGCNCTRNRSTDQLVQLSSMYSHIIDHQYFHVFPWTDLNYSIGSTFPIDSDQFLDSIMNIADFYL